MNNSNSPSIIDYQPAPSHHEEIREMPQVNILVIDCNQLRARNQQIPTIYSEPQLATNNYYFTEYADTLYKKYMEEKNGVAVHPIAFLEKNSQLNRLH